jgi:DNA-binding LacI/PurR family transcriptional regulator
MLFMGDMDFAAATGNVSQERWKHLMIILKWILSSDMYLIQNGLKSIEERDAFLKAIRSEDPPTVLIGANDMISLEAIEVLKKAGIRVPDEIYVVGFDNISEANFAEPKTDNSGCL